MTIAEILEQSVALRASDIFIVPGAQLSFKINGEILPQEKESLSSGVTESLMRGLYRAAGRESFHGFAERGDDDFSFSLKGIGRFRVNAYKQRGSYSCVIRVVLFELPDYKELGIPDAVMDFRRLTKGLVLVTGPAGSGKTTTLSCIIDEINRTRNCHILTLEDPIEFLHRHKKSIVSQREMSIDSDGYVTALRAALRQSPDVILVGEMRDLETIDIAMTAAETGHLVFSTLHTIGAANTIDRIVDVFPSTQQQQIRMQLSMVLQGVVSQQLIPAATGGRAAAFEVMTASNAVRSLIRESKIHQIDSVIYSSADQGMFTMDSSILKLYQSGRISKEDALLYSVNMDALLRQMSRAQSL